MNELADAQSLGVRMSCMHMHVLSTVLESFPRSSRGAVCSTGCIQKIRYRCHEKAEKGSNWHSHSHLITFTDMSVVQISTSHPSLEFYCTLTT